MKIGINFQELQDVLGFCNTVLSDKSVDEKLKNAIFMVTEDEVRIVAYNPFTFSRTELQNVSLIEDIPEGGWEFQVKISELNKIVASFSNLSKTKVDTLYFFNSGVKIGVIVDERAVKEEDSSMSREVNYDLESAPILNNIKKEIHLEFPEDNDLYGSGDLLIYLESFLPLLSNDSTSMSSKLNFGEDYVCAISSHMAAFFKNKLPDALKGISLSYSSVSFMKKLCDSSEDVTISKLDKYICVKAGFTEAFMKHQKIKINYQSYVQRRSKDIGMVVDRLYFKDVLRRMSIIAPDGVISVKDDKTMEVINDTFNQVVPLNRVKAGVEGIKFNISIPVLEKIIVGKEDMFGDKSSELFIYFVPTTRGYILFISDASGLWFSSTQVTKA